MIFVDSNVVMYLVGSDDRMRVDAQRALERQVARQVRLVTSAEVYQEILHRYAAIGRREAIQPALDVLDGVVDEVLPVGRDDVIAAKDIVLSYPEVSSRDALHLSIMRRHRVGRILSYDHDFDAFPDIERLN